MIEPTSSRTELPSGWKKIFLLFIPLIPLLNPPVLNSDIWFLLNGGRYVLQNGIPYIEPFTLHEGLSFVMQQWLSGVVFWLSYSALGRFGLYAVMYAVYVLIMTLLYRLCMLVTEKNFMVSFFVSLLSGAFLSLFIVTRPQIFSLLFMTLELYALESYARTGKRRFLLLLPLLSVLTVNMHASMWPMLFVLMLPYMLGAIPFRRKASPDGDGRLLPLIVCAAVTAACGFLNPYGLDAMIYLLHSYGVPEINALVNEMKVPDIRDSVGKTIFGYILLVTMAYVCWRKGKTKLRYILLTLGPLYLALSAVRGFQIFLICSGFPLASYLKNIELPAAAAAAPDRKTKRLRTVLAALIAVTVLGKCALNVRDLSGDTDAPSTKAAMEFLLRDHEASSIRLYNNYNDGDYSEYLGIPSYMDARAEVFLKALNGREDIFKEYCDLQRGTVFYRDFLEKYDFTHILAAEYDILYTYLEHDGNYRIIYEDDYCRLYEAK